MRSTSTSAMTSRGRPWWHFFALAFSISWSLWLPGFLADQGILSENRRFLGIGEFGKWAGGLGPSLAAIFLVARDGGWQRVRRLLGRVLRVRIGRWYLPTLLIVPVVVVAAHLLNRLIGGVFPQTGALANPQMIPVLFTMFFVLQVSEEYGWRGYALDALQENRTAAIASLILGAFWILWHVPMFLISGFGLHSSGVPFFQYAVTLLCLSFLMTWIQNNTRGSLVPAFTIHAMVNLTGEVMPLQTCYGELFGQETWTFANVLLIGSTVAVLRFWGVRTMGRSTVK